MSDDEDPWKAAEVWTWEQDMARGPWPTQRTGKMPNPPFPDPANPILKALLHDAHKKLASGADAEVTLAHLAVHAWFEGGIEGYDRGQADARAELGT